MCDSLDSELIRVAMESLELELVAEGLYTVTIIDYETGLNHKIKVMVTEGLYTVTIIDYETGLNHKIKVMVTEGLSTLSPSLTMRPGSTIR